MNVVLVWKEIMIKLSCVSREQQKTDVWTFTQTWVGCIRKDLVSQWIMFKRSFITERSSKRMPVVVDMSSMALDYSIKMDWASHKVILKHANISKNPKKRTVLTLTTVLEKCASMDTVKQR